MEKKIFKNLVLVKSFLFLLIVFWGGYNSIMVDVKPGDVFNADDHEAITQIPAPNEDLKGKIIDVIEKGYKLGDKVIRFPKVVIGQ